MKQIGPGGIQKFYFIDPPLNSGSVRQLNCITHVFAGSFVSFSWRCPRFRTGCLAFSLAYIVLLWVQSLDTLGPAYNEFGHNEHPAETSRFLCINIIDCSVKKFGYNEHPLTTKQFLLHHFTRCKREPV